MGMTYAALQAMTEDDLIAAHDAHAKDTTYGVQWFLDELVRRREDRATDALVRLTRVLTWLTVVVAVFTAAGTTAAVYAVVHG